MPCLEAAAIGERYPSHGKVARYWRSGGTQERRVEDTMCSNEVGGGGEATAQGETQLHQAGANAACSSLRNGAQAIAASGEGLETARSCQRGREATGRPRGEVDSKNREFASGVRIGGCVGLSADSYVAILVRDH